MLMISYSKTLFFTTTGFFLLNLFFIHPGKGVLTTIWAL